MASTMPTVDPDNFSQNAFTNFASLLTLFGDELTKQFLSTSVTWMDNILLGIAPLGIMTIITSAIRIGGNGLLKALIGRGRESQFDNQKELLPSTSKNVREIWNGSRVVRQTGDPIIEIFSYDTASSSGSSIFHLDQLASASRFDEGSEEAAALAVSPGLTLNNPKALPSNLTVIGALSLGLVLQAVVVVINACAVYQWQWLRSGRLVAPYGYPTWLAGTVGLNIGVSICAYVVTGTTRVWD